MSSIGYILFLFDGRENDTSQLFSYFIAIRPLERIGYLFLYNVIKEHTLSEVTRVELGHKSIDHASKKEDCGREEERVLKGRGKSS